MDMTAERKKPGRKPAGDKPKERNVDRHVRPRKAFHADQELFDALDAYRRSLRPRPPEAAIIIMALEELLASKGFWKQQSMSN
jgi:hypothetical protein